MMDDVMEFVMKCLVIIVFFGMAFVGSVVIWNGIHGDPVKLGVTCHNVIMGKAILVQCDPSPN